MKVKFKIVKAHWKLMYKFGFIVENESGYWYFLKVIFPDGETKTFNKPFKTFSEPLSVIVDYLNNLRVKSLLTEKSEAEAIAKVLGQKEWVRKDPNKWLHVAGSITTVIGTPIGIGIGIYSALQQKNSPNQKGIKTTKKYQGFDDTHEDNTNTTTIKSSEKLEIEDDPPPLGADYWLDSGDHGGGGGD